MGPLVLIRVVGILAYVISRAWQFASKLRVLLKMPHAGGTSLVGWSDPMNDPTHMPMVMNKTAEQLGGIFSFRILWYYGVIVTDPALAQQVLAKQDLPKAPNIYHVFNTLTSRDGRHPNLVGQPTHEKQSQHWVRRKGVAPAFSPKNIRNEFPHVVELSNQICSILASVGPHTPLDMDNLLQRESLDVIGRIGFDADFGALKSFKLPSDSSGRPGVDSSAAGSGEYHASTAVGTDDVFKLLQDASEELVKRWLLPLRYELRHVLPDARRGERCLRAVQARMWRLMTEIRARGEPAPEDMSVAAHLLRIRDPKTGLPLSDEELASEIGVFFFAGFETTGHSMGWLLYFLATHPECESKVCAELDALGLLATPSRPNPRPLEYANLSKLTYLSMCIKESMRRVPVVGGGSGRVAQQAMELGGYRIPAGTEITVLFWGMHNSARNWERPDEYLPERWATPGAEYWRGPVGTASSSGGGSSGEAAAKLAVPAATSGGVEEDILKEEEDTSNKPPLRFIPFSEGKRNCIGMNLAKMNYTATLAILLSRFTFELVPELRGPGALWGLHIYRVTTQPLNGLRMRCIPRVAAA